VATYSWIIHAWMWRHIVPYLALGIDTVLYSV